MEASRSAKPDWEDCNKPIKIMPPETFPHHQAVHDYAKAHGLGYACEGTAAFEERLRTLSPELFQLLAVHSCQGMRRVILFSKDSLTAEQRKRLVVQERG